MPSTEPQSETTEEAPAQQQTYREKLSRAIGKIAFALSNTLSAGDVATLRRLDATGALSPAFFRIVAEVLEPAGLLPQGDGLSRDEAEQKWTVIVSAMAKLEGLHQPGRRLGGAIAEAGMSELRFERLLRAHDEALHDLIRQTAHYLASKASPCDQRELAELVLSDGHKSSESIRRNVARNFYRAQRQASAKS